MLTTWVRLSPTRAKGIPYRYFLERVDNSGLIRRNQHYVVRPGSLATVHARDYSDDTSGTGLAGWPTNGAASWEGTPSELANKSLRFL